MYKDRPMNKQFQIYNLKRILLLNLDFHSLIDSNLRFPENLDNIISDFPMTNPYRFKRYYQ